MSETQGKRWVSRGKCNFCGQLIAKSGMTRHLQACKQRKAAIAEGVKNGRKARLFHLMVEGKYAIDYWMHIEIPAAATFLDLDQFLRDIWLECCGHLSRFTVGEQEYDVYLDDEFNDFATGTRLIEQFKQAMGVEPPEDLFRHWFRPPPKYMGDARLGDALKPGLKFSHEYDFGTTTDLKLKVIAEREARIGKKFGVAILARNEPPEIICDECGEKPATHLCLECLGPGTGALCKDCARKHSKVHEMFLPVVNSPRVGMCGYTGDAPDDWMDFVEE